MKAKKNKKRNTQYNNTPLEPSTSTGKTERA